MNQVWIMEHWAFWWVLANFVVYLTVFGVALCINYNFNTLMVGVIYLLPLIPIALGPETPPDSWCSRSTTPCSASSNW